MQLLNFGAEIYLGVGLQKKTGNDDKLFKWM